MSFLWRYTQYIHVKVIEYLYEDDNIVIEPETAVDLMQYSNGMGLHGLQQQCEV